MMLPCGSRMGYVVLRACLIMQLLQPKASPKVQMKSFSGQLCAVVNAGL